MNTANPHGRLVRETYTVQGIRQVKCWTILELKNSPGLTLRRRYTDQDLAEGSVGRQIEVERTEHPSLPNSLVYDVTFYGQRIYPV